MTESKDDEIFKRVLRYQFDLELLLRTQEKKLIEMEIIKATKIKEIIELTIMNGNLSF